MQPPCCTHAPAAQGSLPADHYCTRTGLLRAVRVSCRVVHHRRRPNPNPEPNPNPNPDPDQVTEPPLIPAVLTQSGSTLHYEAIFGTLTLSLSLSLCLCLSLTLTRYANYHLSVCRFLVDQVEP